MDAVRRELHVVHRLCLRPDLKPNYFFRSTSAYRNSSDIGGMRITKSGAVLMRTDPWSDEPDGPGVGEVLLPIGEPLILLFFALAFLGVRYYRRRKA